LLIPERESGPIRRESKSKRKEKQDGKNGVPVKITVIKRLSSKEVYGGPLPEVSEESSQGVHRQVGDLRVNSKGIAEGDS